MDLHQSCTDKAAAWNNTYRKKVAPCRIAEMDFASGSHKGYSNAQTPRRRFPKGSEKPDLNIQPDVTKALKKLWDINKSAVVFTTFPKEQYAHDSETDTASECEDEFDLNALPVNLTSVFDPNLQDASLCALREKGREIYQNIIQADSCQSFKYLEEQTRQQAQSPTWFAYRTGRITASRLHGIVTRKLSTPPDSLVQEIMQYKDNVTTAATKWGTDMEKVAIGMYETSLCTQHDNLTVGKSGLVVCENLPYLAASPDGIRQCACHDKVLVEVKCPYKYRDEEPKGVLDVPTFFLDAAGKLKTGHRYYTQIQLQLYVTQHSVCDLVVYTNKGIYVSQVVFDEKFCKSAVSKATQFFFNEVLPELISRKMALSLPCPPGPDRTICFCKKPVTKTRVIQCQRSECSVKQFHYKCIGITKKPADAWYCPVCRKINQE